MIGGYIDQYLNWHWIFYILAIVGGILTVLNCLFFKETLYTPNALKPSPPTSMKERLERLKFNPVSVTKLLKHQVNIMIICSYIYYIVYRVKISVAPRNSTCSTAH